jgi:hypothetical protein
MIKSILVPASGKTFDDAVLETASWAAQPAGVIGSYKDHC